MTDGFATRAIHVGQEPDPATGAVIVPIYQTSTYAQSEVGVHKGYDYSRTANPTRAALEACLASLDNGRFGLAFASGMAAEDTLLHLFESGDHVIACDDVYGGALVTSDEELAERLQFLQNAVGGVPGAFDSWLVLRGVKTLALRMRQHSSNAMEVGCHLEQHRRVKRVYYPGLDSHPQHAL